MKDVQASQPMVDIHVVNLNLLLRRHTNIFVDDRLVGYLNGAHTASFAVSMGIHRVKLRYRRWTSKTLELSLSAGERISLDCGVHNPLAYLASLFLVTYITANLLAVLLCIIVLPLTASRVFVLTFIASSMILCWNYTRAGAYLYLEPRRDPRTAYKSTIFAILIQRIAILRLIMLIAAVAVVLGIAVEERTKQKMEQYRLLTCMYQQRSQFHAEAESLWKRHGELLQGPAHARRAAQRADYHARLKHKYLNAASRPWVRPEKDPPLPK